MLRWVLSFLILAATARADTPFWKSKSKVYERVRVGEIMVSVKSIAGRPPFQHTLRISGGGHVRAPKTFVVSFAQDFDQVARLSGFIEKSVYHKDRGQLELDLAALGHRAHMQIAVKAILTDSPRIVFEVLRGPLEGLESQVAFSEVSARVTEVGMDGHFNYNTFPIPRLFLQFGLEVVFQKMAARLRAEVESAYKAQGDGHS